MLIVIKIGSSSIVDERGVPHHTWLNAVVDDIIAAGMAGHRVIVVSSGAIATGIGLLTLDRRPSDLPSLQAASAVGQGELFSLWAHTFRQRQRQAAQILLTMHDVGHRTAYLNARGTLMKLLDWGIVPIVNENDTTATDEITFGDNDMLAAQVAVAMEADRLLLLTDTDGLYTAHPDEPGSERIDLVDDYSLLKQVDTATVGSHWGSGGMRSKVIAAEMARVGGTESYIARAREANIVSRIAAGEHIGTRILADKRTGSSYKLWVRYAKPSRGTICVDDGAAIALVSNGASLLAVGVSQHEGSFRPGDAVTVQGVDGREIARGIVDCSSEDLARACNNVSHARAMSAVIHRDDLVVYGTDSVTS